MREPDGALAASRTHRAALLPGHVVGTETLLGDPAGKTGLCLLSGFASSHKYVLQMVEPDVE